jgi:sulfatase maturation enzyme AslB (radical SAM superfamily)
VRGRPAAPSGALTESSASPGLRRAPVPPATLTLYLTERCNFRCSYCYQARGRRTMTPATLEKALDVCLPRLADPADIYFYGGEPLLAFDLIRRAVESVEKRLKARRRVRFGLTTNGSLIDGERLDFFRDHAFRIMVSYDGTAQEIARRPGSSAGVLAALKRLLGSRGIRVETNSVFTPATVRHLSSTVRILHKLGVPKIHLAFSNLEPWPARALAALERELADARRFAVGWRRRTGRVPLAAFRAGRRRRIFVCGGGANQIAVAPEGTVWGCHLFIDHFRASRAAGAARAYIFGSLDRYARMDSRREIAVASRYGALRMTRFATPDRACFGCPDVEDCEICPLAAAVPGSELGIIPRWACRIAQMMRAARRAFWETRSLSGS